MSRATKYTPEQFAGAIRDIENGASIRSAALKNKFHSVTPLRYHYLGHKEKMKANILSWCSRNKEKKKEYDRVYYRTIRSKLLAKRNSHARAKMV